MIELKGAEKDVEKVTWYDLLIKEIVIRCPNCGKPYPHIEFRSVETKKTGVFGRRKVYVIHWMCNYCNAWGTVEVTHRQYSSVLKRCGHEK